MSARSFELFGTRKRFGNVTIEKDKDTVYVILHSTIVVEYNRRSGDIRLNNGGWYTVTTKTCINEALRQLKYPGRVYQEKGEWYLYLDGARYDYNNNMVVPQGLLPFFIEGR